MVIFLQSIQSYSLVVTNYLQMGWGWVAAPIASGVFFFLSGSLLAQIVNTPHQRIRNNFSG
ncbi:hypothetical protein J0895_09680 [Phormidium pseudopriestleyi FRX01]|uniref:Uncharacterized protein n=1 Tax=Phormidium pseudopriestleyi FRX01 TaxID=1759528 RepID=A0ABS3FQL8_9CYAN|nr:hypothetical protein [Phormidium pseudopriestleyi]MBO0349370.1 hypothetical protein [Phormidium pseudopriestleyi FRX01]